MNDSFFNTDMLRLRFSEKLVTMFSAEVPAYNNLINLVRHINNTDDTRINRERHGAIRLGLPSELQFMKRLFAVYGMYPVQYYNLSTAGIPVHSTAFRPIDAASLEFCPFRVFTSLLKLDFITDTHIHAQAKTILETRSFIPDGLTDLMIKSEHQQGLYTRDAQKLIDLSLHIFGFNHNAITDYHTYNILKNLHPIIADIVCFNNPHINHLTPRTLDIDTVQMMMPQYNINPKAIIEGPPRRNIPILLRQTSFKAVPENIYFKCGMQSTHTARFGEIEQRGFALSHKGRTLYDKLLNMVNQTISVSIDGTNADLYYQTLNTVFSEFPDDMKILLEQNLLSLSESKEPYIYEDFLPVSAAGIFTSNLGTKAITQSYESDFSDFCLGLGDIPLMP